MLRMSVQIVVIGGVKLGEGLKQGNQMMPLGIGLLGVVILCNVQRQLFAKLLPRATVIRWWFNLFPKRLGRIDGE